MFAEVSGLSITMNVVILILSFMMIILILVQRGKGGGLAGALGGAGGSSAFGSRAGDAFTKITLYMAGVWVLLIMIHVKIAQPIPTKAAPDVPEATSTT